MLTNFDKDLEKIVATVKPRWTEIKMKKRFFERLDQSRFVSTEIGMIGETSLSCSVGDETVEGENYDYCPLYLLVLAMNEYDSEEWVTLARAGGLSELDKRLSWFFEQPRLRLITKEDGFADSMADDATWETLFYYGGIEFSDPSGQKSLRLDATDSNDYLLYLTIKD